MPAPLALLIALALFVSLQQLMHRQLQSVLLLAFGAGRAALWLYALLLLPGVALHEFSHWLTAKLLLVRTHKFSLMPARAAGGKIRFGAVETDSVDPVRASLIGLAPLLLGVACLTLLAVDVLGLGELAQLALQLDLRQAVASGGELLQRSDAWLWLYFVFAISNTMLPSSADRAAWLPVLLLFGALVLVAFAAGLGQSLTAVALPAVYGVANRLALLFLVAAVLNLILIVPLTLAKAVLSRLSGWQVG